MGLRTYFFSVETSGILRFVTSLGNFRQNISFTPGNCAKLCMFATTLKRSGEVKGKNSKNSLLF